MIERCWNVLPRVQAVTTYFHHFYEQGFPGIRGAAGKPGQDGQPVSHTFISVKILIVLAFVTRGGGGGGGTHV